MSLYKSYIMVTPHDLGEGLQTLGIHQASSGHIWPYGEDGSREKSFNCWTSRQTNMSAL
jgi:hypothetical protein